MDLGIGLFTCQRRPGDDRGMTELYDEMLQLGRAADDAGLASAWVSEHHFADDGYLSGTMPALGALAAATDRIEIGPCIALAPLYDAVHLAEDAATVSLLADGRLTMGLAIGYREAEFDAFGVPTEERGPRTEEAVRVLRGAWSDGPIGIDPEFHDISPGMTVTPKPNSPPPLILGGAAQPAVRRAARLGEGWIAPSSLTISDIETRIADIERVREAEGIEGDFTTYVLQHGFIADSREDAWQQMRDGYLYMQRRYAEWFGGEPIDELDQGYREELRDRAILGTPEQVAADIDAYRAALGSDIHFIFRCYQPGTGTEAMLGCVKQLGDEVVPALGG